MTGFWLIFAASIALSAPHGLDQGAKFSAKPLPVAADAPMPELVVAEKCRNLGVKQKGTRIVGKVLDTVAGDKVSRLGTRLFAPILDVGSVLTNAVACRLDPAEQRLAADATSKVVATETVNTRVNWHSQTRTGVSGASMIASKMSGAAGQKCLLVADFVIVDGEETRVEKRMCRAAGAARYSLSA